MDAAGPHADSRRLDRRPAVAEVCRGADLVRLASRALGETAAGARADCLLLLLHLGLPHFPGPLPRDAPPAPRFRARFSSHRRRRPHPAGRCPALAARSRPSDGGAWSIHSGQHDPGRPVETVVEPIEPRCTRDAEDAGGSRPGPIDFQHGDHELSCLGHPRGRLLRHGPRAGGKHDACGARGRAASHRHGASDRGLRLHAGGAGVEPGVDVFHPRAAARGGIAADRLPAVLPGASGQPDLRAGRGNRRGGHGWGRGIGVRDDGARPDREGAR